MDLLAVQGTHVARLEFPRETGLILRCAGKAGNPFQTTQGQNAGLDEAQVGIKIAGRNINNLRYADDTTLMA